MKATPLERELLRTIAAGGPLALDRYMALCLGHPRHGYYMTREPFGTAGDFVTAPEITQMFGEMIGIWCAHVFELMGSPGAFDVIELGPGRGTLMADVLRSAKVMAGLLPAARVRLVETSQRLREAASEDPRFLARSAELARYPRPDRGGTRHRDRQ